MSVCQPSVTSDNTALVMDQDHTNRAVRQIQAQGTVLNMATKGDVTKSSPL